MASIVPTRLRCNLLSDPLAIADERPRLSWMLEHTEPEAKDARQTAYQIRVSSQAGGDADFWDSGRTESSETLCVEYAGKNLAQFQTAYWRVRVWDENGGESEWSDAAQWTQAPDKWPAKWITYHDPQDRARPFTLEGAHWIWHEDDPPMKSPPGVCFFRTTFELEETAKVDIAASADDSFVLRIDGKEVCRSDDEPHSWSRPQYSKIEIEYGEHTVEANVENCNEGAGAFIAKISSSSGQTVTDKAWQARKQESDAWKGSQSLIEYGGAPWGRLREQELHLPPSQSFSRSFQIERPVRRAVLYSTALGIIRLHVNAKRVGEDWFAPGWTDYDKRLHYRAHDVTRLLEQGTNCFTADLSDGWFAGYIGFKPERNHYGEDTWFSAFVRIEYEDGETEIVSTDEESLAMIQYVNHSDFLMGELCGSFEPEVCHVTPLESNRILEPYPMNPVAAYATVPAKKIQTVGRATVYDLGQNFAGVCRLQLDHLDEDKEVTLRHAEALNEDGSIYTKNLRTARATDTVVGDDGPIDWTPRGTYHGFRYVELTGFDDPPLNAITGVALSNIHELASTFECSDERLNKLWQNICWTQRSNFIEIPTDCPQRDERLGWTGDIQIYARTAALVGDVQAFLRKWLTDLTDAQRDDGQYPMVAPLKVAGDDGGPAWSEAGVIVPWALYQAYDDEEVLERQWDSMVRFMSFSKARSPDGRAPKIYYCFGDWLDIDAETPNDVIFTAYIARSADLMARIAGVLGRDASRYEELFARARSTFVEQYIEEDGTVEGDTQTGYVMALAFGLLDGPQRTAAAGKLVENIERHGHLTTGFVGAKDLMLVLRDIGRVDLAYKLLLSDEHLGWLHSVKHGATTIWERWNGWTPEEGFANPAMNSFSHYALGAVGQFMFETIAGIRPLEPGYKRILIAPEPGPLTSAAATYDSVRGRIATDWRIENGRFNLKLSVPPNTEAVIRLPSGEEQSVGSGQWKFEESTTHSAP
ncbi:MAG: family 78 glycoside hydrolase catalytic domain [Armatimonadetes bacterium]|nr:family 78 glycoside hydrolase catalytic domain [Armatimonadota bacterium]